MADWVALRNEYISTRISTRDLAQKHDVKYATLRDRAARERWSELRAEHTSKVVAKTEQKTIEAVSSDHASRVLRLIEGGERSAELLLVRLDQMSKSGKVKPYEIKAITESLKHIRDLYRIDTGADDVKYQKARELLGGVPDALDG